MNNIVFDRCITIQKLDELTEKWTDVFNVHARINKAQSDNEYLRHIFFERVEEYNRQYDLYVQDLNNPWFDWLVYDNVDDIEHIKFNWRGVPND
jgi:hypothetical protein